MRAILIPAIAAGFAAALLAAPRPAAALPAPTPLVQGETNAGLVEDVARRWRYYRRPYAYRPYAYRPYYRPYGYYRPYPYYGWGGYGWGGYPYWGRPGINLWFGL